MRTFLTLVCSLALAAAAWAEQFAPIVPAPPQPNITLAYPPVILDTNPPIPILDGPLIDFLGQLANATNWGLATFAIAANQQDSKLGAGGMIMYNINPWVATGVGIDWLDGELTVPSAQFQFQAPLRIGGSRGVLLRPFAFTGVALPIADDADAPVAGLIGAGLGIKIYKGFNAFYAIEYRTGQPGHWQLFGLAWSAAF